MESTTNVVVVLVVRLLVFLALEKSMTKTNGKTWSDPHAQHIVDVDDHDAFHSPTPNHGNDDERGQTI
jgi:hypothetical protein